ncbi:MAG: hypothetical protein AB1716_10315 [Planctomycetota bacterium]
MIDRLRELIGRECALAEVSASLQDFVRTSAAPVIGALEVTCSDETEAECAGAFAATFAAANLPELKPQLRAPFRTANLGARYEVGSVRVAEQHYATHASASAYKLMIVKINAHVAISAGPLGPSFGPLRRYDTRSTACGALHALLKGDKLPALEELRQTFALDGQDRIAALLDPTVVPPDHRFLFAAVVQAVLQTRRAVDDIHAHPPHSPTLYVVVPCVTLNRPDAADTELVCGCHVVDRRPGATADRYWGLADDPARLRVQTDLVRLRVEG